MKNSRQETLIKYIALIAACTLIRCLGDFIYGTGLVIAAREIIWKCSFLKIQKDFFVISNIIILVVILMWRLKLFLSIFIPVFISDFEIYFFLLSDFQLQFSFVLWKRFALLSICCSNLILDWNYLNNLSVWRHSLADLLLFHFR